MQVNDPAPPVLVPTTISAVPLDAAANVIHAESNTVGEGEGDGGVVGAAASAGAGVAALSQQEEEGSLEPVPKRLRPHDPAVQIRETTNDGDAGNSEMLIHLKASRCWYFARKCSVHGNEIALHFLFP